MKKIILILPIAFLCLQACFPMAVPPRETFLHDSGPFDTLIREMTEELSMVSPEEFSPGQKLLVTTLVDLNNLEETSAFGRLLSERLTTSMGDLGFDIVEVRRGSAIYVIEKKGEMILTRKQGEIPDTIQAGAVIYGTYLTTEREVLVTARIARASDFMILKSWNGKIPRTHFIENLLKDRFFEVDVYERIPAKE